MITLHADLTEGTENTRIKGGKNDNIDDARLGAHARFIANRIKLGDLEQVLRDPNAPATAGDHAKPATEADTASSSTTDIATPAAPAKKE